MSKCKYYIENFEILSLYWYHFIPFSSAILTLLDPFSYLLMMSNLSSRLNQFRFLLGVSLLDSNFLFNGVDLVAIFVSYDLQDLVKTKF